MNAKQMHERFGRRRQIEVENAERKAATNNYFQKWGRVTSRHETWTAPEYYMNANEKVQKKKAEKTHEMLLGIRQEKLRKLLEKENQEIHAELQLREKQRIRKLPDDVLNNLKLTMEKTENEKRRLDLESKLYSRWRHGSEGNADDSLFQSPQSINTALAKLNWLDKQIENSMLREKEEKEKEERQLQMQIEVRKREENLTKQLKVRDKEMKNLKELQEMHLKEFKNREKEYEMSVETECKLKSILECLVEEKLKLIAEIERRSDRNVGPYNLRRVKLLLRQRSMAVVKELEYATKLLNKLKEYITNEKTKNLIMTLCDEIEKELGIENKNLAQIEGMYDSEAKQFFMDQEECWKRSSDNRDNTMRRIIVERIDEIKEQLVENGVKQKNLLNVKEKHLQALESTSKSIDELIEEQKAECEKALLPKRICGKPITPRSKNTKKEIKTVEKKISNLHLVPDTATLSAPKFGKKRIAWT